MEQKEKGLKNNKWMRAAIPALLLHCSIGTVYCWSIFSQEIADYIGFSKGATEWAFSLAIFFLGMSAAFLGNVVEKDIHKSSLIATMAIALGSRSNSPCTASSRNSASSLFSNSVMLHRPSLRRRWGSTAASVQVCLFCMLVCHTPNRHQRQTAKRLTA